MCDCIIDKISLLYNVWRSQPGEIDFMIVQMQFSTFCKFGAGFQLLH